MGRRWQLKSCLLVGGAALLGIPAGTAQAANIVTATGLTISPAEQQQTGRLIREGVPSNCANPPKPTPSLNDEDPRRYRIHTFASSLTHPVCITASLSTSCTIFSAAYFGQFNPANIRENHAADLSNSTPTQTSYSFAPGGDQRFAIVVHELDPNTGCASPGYNLTVTSDRPWANSVPTVNGAPTPGSVLTGTDATWSVTPAAPVVERRWVRCDETGANCVDIPGATAPTYTVTDADVGQTLRFRNHATDVGGTSTSQSLAVEPFIPFETHDGSLGPGDRVLNGFFVRTNAESRCAAPNAAPTVIFPASNFLYDPYPVASLVNEPVCLVARTVPSCIGGATAQIYDPAFDPVAGLLANYAGNSGRSVNDVGTASVPFAAGGTGEVVVSNGAAGNCDSYAVTIGANAPFATARPAISGTPVENGALTATDGTWSGTPAIDRSWRRCDSGGNACEPIQGANGVSYTPTGADVGSRLRLRVTAAQGETVSSDSEPSEIVAAAPDQGGEADRDPPDGRIRKVKVKGDNVKVVFGADEARSTFECRLDKRRFKPCTSPKRYRNLDPGKHRVFVLATDAAGNKDDKAAKAKFKVR